MGELPSTAQSAPRIREALAKGGNTNVRVQVFPKAGHPRFECETGLRNKVPTLSKYVPGYSEALADWLKVQAGT